MVEGEGRGGGFASISPGSQSARRLICPRLFKLHYPEYTVLLFCFFLLKCEWRKKILP